MAGAQNGRSQRFGCGSRARLRGSSPYSEGILPPRLPDLFVALDTETTGLSPVGDRVLEIAAAAFRADGYVGGEFGCLVDPGIPIPPELTRIHGITDEMVAGRPSVEEVLPEFLRFVADSVLVAHNAPYDVAMLMLPLIRMRGRSAHRPPNNLVLDTCT